MPRYSPERRIEAAFRFLGFEGAGGFAEFLDLRFFSHSDMTEEEWFSFIASGKPEVVSVARLPIELCRAIDSSSSLVRMRHDYALKSAQKHRLRAAHFPMLPIVIDVGRVICDRPRHLSFYMYENVVFGGWLAATIKSNGAGTELWVATFHIASPAEAKRMAKKYKVIRPEKF